MGLVTAKVGWGTAREERGGGLTEVLQHTVALQLRVSDLVLQQNQLLLILVLESLQPPLAVLQLVNQFLLDLDLTRQVSQVCLEVHLCGGRDKLNAVQGAEGGVGALGLSFLCSAMTSPLPDKSHGG